MSATVSFNVASAQGEQSVTLSYTRRGSGEPLLLLHGIGHHRQAWEPVIPALAAERDVIAVDLPGCGDSPALPDGMAHDLPTMSTVLKALFGALEIDRPHVAGNSLGGLLALTWPAPSSSARSPPCPPPGSGTRPSAATPSPCCRRCGRSPGACRRRWSSGWPARPSAAPC